MATAYEASSIRFPLDSRRCLLEVMPSSSFISCVLLRERPAGARCRDGWARLGGRPAGVGAAGGVGPPDAWVASSLCEARAVALEELRGLCFGVDLDKLKIRFDEDRVEDAAKLVAVRVDGAIHPAAETLKLGQVSAGLDVHGVVEGGIFLVACVEVPKGRHSCDVQARPLLG